MQMLQNQEQKGYIQVFIAGALWGCIGPLIQLMEQYGSNAFFTSFLRMAFSFLILAAITAAKYGVSSFRIRPKALLSCALLGLICHGIYNVFYSVAVVKAGVSVSAVLLNTAPIFTLIFSCLLFQEKITGIKIVALIVNILGCTLAAGVGSFDAVTFSVVGIVCGVGAGLCYALTAIIGRLAGETGNIFVVSTYSYLFAAVFLMLFSRPFGEAAQMSKEVYILGFFLALIPTAIAYLFYYQGLQKITESSRVPVIASVETVVAVIIGVAAFKEKLTAISLAGILMVIFSILLMNRKHRCAEKRCLEEIDSNHH